MIDTLPLEQQIQSPAARLLAADDPDINELLTLAEHNEILRAAGKAQELWQQRLYDVRTLGCYLGGVFMERGLAALPLVMNCLLRALTLNWEYLGPAQRKQRLCDVSLRWLFTTLCTQIDFHQRARGEQWERWTAGWTQSTYMEAADLCVQLSALLEDVLPKARCAGPLLNLKSLLEGIVRPSTDTAGWKNKLANATVVPPPPPASEPSSSAAEASQNSSSSSDSSPSSSASAAAEGSTGADSQQSPDAGVLSGQSTTPLTSDLTAASTLTGPLSSSASVASSADSGQRSAKSAESDSAASANSSRAAAAAVPPPVPTGESATFPLSPALRALMRQLDGFALLIQKGELNKAAVIYRQIQPRIEKFDPRYYLPSLFGPFYAQLARHGRQLAVHLKEPADLGREALDELCRVDLELFLETEVSE